MPPLKWLKENPPIEGHSRQIFLLTDGEISNVDEVLNLCRSMAVSTRIFSFGLGHAPSRSLIKGLARATNGRFVFIPPGTYVDVYVGEQLQKALQPCITNVRIKLNLDPTLVSTVPTSSPPVFINDRLIVYALLNDGKLTSFDHDVSVELYSGQYRLCEATVSRIPSVSNDGMIARLAAKALILELQHAQSLKEETQMTMQQIKEKIIEISLKYNILSSYTAFVGVENRINASNADMVLREVPIQISADSQYLKYLETKMSQMRHDQAKQEQMRHMASYIQHDYDQLRYQDSYISRMVDEDDRRAERNFVDTCKDYDRARMEFTSALKKYDEAQKHFDSTSMDKDEAKKYIDGILNDYDEARGHLDDTRTKYNEARQYLDDNRMEYDETQRHLDRAFRNNDYDRHDFGRASMEYDQARQHYSSAINRYGNLQQDFDHVINSYDKAEQHYNHLIHFIDKSHQLQKKPSVEEEEQVLQRYIHEIDFAEERFQDARKTLHHFKIEKKDMENRLERARDSLKCCANEIRSSVMESMYDEDQMTSSEIRYAKKLLDQVREKQPSKKSRAFVREYDEKDLAIVRRIIAEQKFDGLWNLDVNTIEQLTGKSLSVFQQLTNSEMFISAIIIVILETRFASLMSMWYGVVQKARKRLLNMHNNDNNKFTTLLEDIQKQL